MKKMLFAACAMVAAFAAVADDAPPPPRFLGFALGGKVDAAVCKARGHDGLRGQLRREVRRSRACLPRHRAPRQTGLQHLRPPVICGSSVPVVNGQDARCPSGVSSTGEMPVVPVHTKRDNLIIMV